MASILSSLVRRIPHLLTLPTTSINTRNALRALSTTNTLFIPNIQGKAPNFEGIAVHHDKFITIRLSDFKGKYLVLMFYPLDFTFVCPTELIAVDTAYNDFRNLDCEVIGISVDSHYTHFAWQRTPRDQGGLGRLAFPLLSDLNKTIARDYGVLLPNEGVALRGTFIIDPEGVLRCAHVNDLAIGRSIGEILRTVEAIKTVEEMGEVCPANWKAGDKTIKPDPKGSFEYFESLHKK